MKKVDSSTIPGFVKAAEGYMKFDILGFISRNESYLMLLEFIDGTIGLCVYSTFQEFFCEEPADLADYGETVESISNQYLLFENILAKKVSKRLGSHYKKPYIC